MTDRLTLVLWGAGFLGNSFLCFILLTRKHWYNFPIFTILAGYEAARALCLFMISQAAMHSLYIWCYWISEALDIILQIGLLYEIGSLTILSRPINTAFVSSRVISRHIVALAVVLAVACSLAVPPVAAVEDTIDMRACLFTSLLTCELYLLILTKANRLRLAQTGLVMAISNGITLWAVCAVISDVIHQIGGWENQALRFDKFKSETVVMMLFYWVVIFWRSPGSRTDSTRVARAADVETVYSLVNRASQ